MKVGIKSSDVHISGNIWTSLQCHYQSYDKVKTLSRIVQTTMSDFRDLLDLPSNLRVRLCNFKTHKVNGRYYGFNNINVAELSVRMSPAHFLEVLAHELVHAEQFHTGRLGYIGRMYTWNGSVNTNRGTTYARYRNQPWEQEAFGRQRELAMKVLEMNQDNQWLAKELRS